MIGTGSKIRSPDDLNEPQAESRDEKKGEEAEEQGPQAFGAELSYVGFKSHRGKRDRQEEGG